MQKFRIKYFIFFFVLVGLAGSSCKENKEPETMRHTTVKVEKKAEELKPENNQEKKPEKKTPESCTIDDDCKTYFRCLDFKCSVPPAISGVKSKTTPTATIKKANGSSSTFNLELAVSIKQMTRGLMYRKTMLDDWGMLFVYDDVRVRSFWMQNTLIPLDMLFIDEKGKVVGIVEGAEPMTLKARTVGKPAKYVLELIAGRAKALGFKAGDTMTLTGVEDWQNIEK